MIQIGVDIFPLVRGATTGGDVDPVDELGRLLAEDRLPVAHVRLVVAVDLHVRTVVERVEAAVVAVALAFVAVHPDTFENLIKLN